MSRGNVRKESTGGFRV